MRLLAALALLLLPSFANAELSGFITGGKTDELNVVCWVPVKADDPAANSAAVQFDDKSIAMVQRVKQGEQTFLVFVLPKLKAGEKFSFSPDLRFSQGPKRFKFVEEKGQYTDLLLGERPVLRFINAPHDAADHFLTFKPFHHVFDPATGKTLLTSGAYKTNKEGLYPHHRGLFFGWNKISYDGKTADIWHGTENVYSQFDKVISEDAGPVLGRQKSALSWHGKDGKTFITEERELMAYAAPGGTLIDFASVLKTDRPSVKLDGDPQHAGFHFRANMEVSNKEVAKETYYLRPDGKGKPGETRNWDAKGADPRTVNLPWNAMSYLVGGKRYTTLRINHPDNPKDSRGSERDYGRFGDYFEYEVTPAKPLKVKYRVWIQEGEMTVEQCAAMAAGFVSPPKVKVLGK